MNAVVAPFPGTAPVVPDRASRTTPAPVITITRYAKPPAERPWKATPSTWIIPDLSGWVVEGLNHPGGGIAVLGHFRNEDTAWQEATRIATANGWQAIRDRRVALAAARNSIVGGARQ